MLITKIEEKPSSKSSSSSSSSIYSPLPGGIYRLNSDVSFFRLWWRVGGNSFSSYLEAFAAAVNAAASVGHTPTSIPENIVAYPYLKDGTVFKKNSIVLYLRPSPIVEGVTCAGCWDVLYDTMVVPLNKIYLDPIFDAAPIAPIAPAVAVNGGRTDV